VVAVEQVEEENIGKFQTLIQRAQDQSHMS
jgi:hypothetical protein